MTEINRSERKKTGAMNLRSTVKVGKWLTKKKKKKWEKSLRTRTDCWEAERRARGLWKGI